jgi:acyl carrier protein
MSLDGLSRVLRDRVAILVDIAPESVQDDMPLDDLGLDSLMLLELVAVVEQHVGFELPENELPGLTSIQKLIDFVARYAEP